MMKILCLDGGGIRGVATARILSHIEGRFNRPIYEMFDLIAGSSTGGILACGLALPDASGRNRYWSSDLEDLYIQERHRIFKRSWFYKIRSANGYLMPKYDGEGLTEVMNDYFGQTFLSESLKPVLLTAYCCNERRAFFFKSKKIKSDAGHAFTFAQAAISTASAPTYFPSYEVAGHQLVDGGVHSNNPSMCAIAEAISWGVKPEEIKLLSIGTGTHKAAFPANKVKRWGALEWIKSQNTTPLVDVMLEDDEIGYQARQILGDDRYLRLDYEFSSKFAMDDVSLSCIEHCLAEAEKVVQINKNRINEFLS